MKSRSLLVLLSASVCLGRASAVVPLVQGGRAQADVIVARDASADERSAAAELTYYIKKATGAELSVRPAREPGRAAVLIGLSAAPADIRARVRRLDGEGFAIEASGDTLVLAGKGEHGTSFAVYEFLERFAGIRWLWPGDLGEVVPAQKTLAAEDVALTRQPAFLWRDLGPGGELWGPKDRWEKERELGVSVEHQAIERQWELRNRFGGERIFGGHAFGMILPPSVYGPTHPEYYALVNGKRDTWQRFDGKHGAQLCTTNPEVIRMAIEYCDRILTEHPELDGVSIMPNDGRGFCECDACTKLDTGRTQHEEADPEMGRARETRIITDRIVHFANLVAAGVDRAHPGKKVMLHAYSQYHVPPSYEPPRPNVLMIYSATCPGFWNDAERQRVFEDFAGWSRQARVFGVCEHMTQMNFPDMPRLVPPLIQAELQELRQLGARYYQTQAGNGYAVNGLNTYVLGKLLWDPGAGVRAIQADYIQKAFGPAAPAMTRYFDRLIASWREQKSRPATMNSASLSDYRGVLRMYPAGLREACVRDLDQAGEVATGTYRRRVEFVRQGFHYFELTMDAAAATYPLLEAGWGFGKKGAREPAHADRQALNHALDLWRDRDRDIETHREDFVLSYLWVKCNDQTRTFNPLWWMTAAKGDPVR